MPQLARAIHESIDQVRVEALERARPAMQDGHARAGLRGDVRELDRILGENLAELLGITPGR